MGKSNVSESFKRKFAWVVLGLAIFTVFYMTFSSSAIKKKDTGNKEKGYSSIVEGKKSTGKKKPKVKILTEELALRSSPGVSYGNQIGIVRKGAVLKYLGKVGSWYKVKTPGNRKGYISAKADFAKKIN